MYSAEEHDFDQDDAMTQEDNSNVGETIADALVDESDDSPDPLEKLQSEHTELKDKYLRLMAEFDNFRKRTARQRNEERATAAIGTMNELLPVLDDFDRAKAMNDDENSTENFSNGVSLVYDKFKRTLNNLGLKQMESTGKAFDPDKHEAITEIPAPNPELSGKVIDTIEAGYLLNDRIIRHAKVVVGK